MYRKKKAKKLTRAEKKLRLKLAILGVFADYKKVGFDRPNLTARKIATNLGRSVAPSFRAVCYELVDDGKLELVSGIHYNGKPIYYFALPGEGRYHEMIAGFDDR